MTSSWWTTSAIPLSRVIRQSDMGPKNLTGEQAMKAYNEGWIVATGGYTFVKIDNHHYYSAYGVLPNCLRGGDCVDLTKAPWRDYVWHCLTVEEWVREQGFCLDPYQSVSFVQLIVQRPEHYIPIQEMAGYQTDSQYTYSDFTDPLTSAKIWTEFFDKKKAA